MTAPVPFVTPHLPGTGGRFREADEDFLVEEVPAYEPCGAGDHLFLRVEKRGITTHEAARRIAHALGRRPGDVGFAGQKDAHAVAVQWFSVEHVEAAAATAALADVEGVRVLGAIRHRNKLKLGHLRGNRFRIVIRGVGEGAAANASAVLAHLERHGAPNGFGEQRFGMRGDNHEVGRALVRGDADAACALITALPGDATDPRVAEARSRVAAGDPGGAAAALPGSFRNERTVLAALGRGRTTAQALRDLPKDALRFYVSAYQSALFNRLLAERIALHADDGGLGRVEVGDLAFLHARGAVFRVEDAAAEQPRADALEISPSGPMFGTETLLADGEPGRRERELLAAEGLAPGAFRVPGAGSLDGERRPFRVPLTDAGVEDCGGAEPAIVVSFTLPRGSFATSVLREVMKG